MDLETAALVRNLIASQIEVCGARCLLPGFPVSLSLLFFSRPAILADDFESGSCIRSSESNHAYQQLSLARPKLVISAIVQPQAAGSLVSRLHCRFQRRTEAHHVNSVESHGRV